MAVPDTPDDEPTGRAAPKKPTSAASGARRAAASYDVTVKDLLDAGLLRPGARLRKRYLGRDLSAKVEADGRIRFGEEVHNSLSIAAGAARVAVKGPPEDGRRYYQTNGWTFWEYEGEDGKAQPIEALRERYLSERSATPE